MRVLSLGLMAGLAFLLPACLAGQTRVFITDSNSWQVSGGFGANVETPFGSHSGGARPQTVELIKTFGERCHTVTVTIDRNKADYVIMFDREGGKVAGTVNRVAYASADTKSGPSQMDCIDLTANII